MEELIESLKKALADTFALYFKAHSFHWNVEGPDFIQYHGLFGDVYDQAFGEVDTIAEHIRALDAYAPSSLGQMRALSSIQEEAVPSDAVSMVRRLYDANNMVIVSLLKAYQSAEAANEVGVSNFLQDLIDKHQKTGWMLRSTIK